MSEQNFERLAYRNKFVKHLVQETEGTDCFVPFVNLNESDNLVVLRLSAAKITRMLSSLMNGADLTYPDESMQIVVDFLSGIHCPPVMEEQECFEYPTYASFMRFNPTSPYVEPDTVPDGYLMPPFQVNGQNGIDLTDYEPFDIIVPYGAFELLGGWFDLLDGLVPTIEILVQGEGTAFVKMLAVPLGGLAVIEVDNPPNFLDILAGIVTSSDNIIDLNLDEASLPPETVRELIFEVRTIGSGLHTIYISFLPILDDSLVPLRFGGGFRGVQLCNYVEVPEMGIQSIRLEACELQVLIDGEWEAVAGWEDLNDCIDHPEGGSGGAAAMTTRVQYLDIVSNRTTTSTTMVAMAGSSFSHTPTRANMLVIVDNVLVTNSAGTSTQVAIRFDGNGGVEYALGEIQTTAFWPMQISARFEPSIGVAHNLELYWKVSSGTATCAASLIHNWVIIEYDNPEDLFVEDIRINGEELQKKIGGTWITVSDSLKTLFDAVQATAATALANANSAISTNATQAAQIAAIVTVNNTQAASLTALDGRLDSVESDVDSLMTVDIPQINIDIAALTSRVDGLDFGGVWAWFHAMTSGSNGYTLTGSAGGAYSAGNGWPSDSNGLEIEYTAEAVLQNQVNFVQVIVRYTGSPTGTPQFKVNDGAYAPIEYNGVGVDSYGWYIVPNTMTTTFKLTFAGSGNFYLRGVRYLGRGTNLPFD